MDKIPALIDIKVVLLVKLLKYNWLLIMSSGFIFILRISSLAESIGHMSPLSLVVQFISNLLFIIMFLGSVHTVFNSIGWDKTRLKFITSSLLILLYIKESFNLNV